MTCDKLACRLLYLLYIEAHVHGQWGEQVCRRWPDETYKFEVKYDDRINAYTSPWVMALSNGPVVRRSDAFLCYGKLPTPFTHHIYPPYPHRSSSLTYALTTPWQITQFPQLFYAP